MVRAALQRLRQVLVEPPPVYAVDVQHKSRLLSIFLLLMIVIFAGVDAAYVLTVPGYAVPWYGYLFLLTAYLLNRLPYYHVSAWLVLIMFPIVIFSTILNDEANDPGVSLGFLMLGLVIASILLSIRGVFFLALVNSAGIFLLLWLAPRSFPEFSSIVAPLAIFMIGSALLLVSMRHRDRVEADRQALLRQSEVRYRMLFEEAPDGIMIVSPDNRILMANAVLYQMTGYSSQDILGRSPSEFVAPEDLAIRPPRPFEQIQVPGPMKRERVILRKDGSRRNVVISSSYMPDGHLQFIIQDITTRKKIEDALRSSEEKFAKSFQSSPDAVTISSIATGKFIDVNDGFCKMSGYAREEALGRSAEELHIWQNVEHRRLMVEILQKDGSVRDLEAALRRKTGETVQCLLSVEAIEIGGEKCMVVITRDITERKRMEQELRLSEERYRMVSSVISDYTFFTRVDEEGRLRMLWIAGAFEKITGYTLDEFEALGGWAATIHPEDIAQDERDMGMLRANQRVVSEIRTLRKDGSICWTRVYAHPIWDAEKDQLAGIYGAVQDINEQKKVEQEREGLIRELEAKNAELEQFTYMVSHDLKAPLITIKGFLGFLAEDAAAGNMERLEADLRRISDAADKMHSLLNDLLELSRIGRLMNDPQEVSFGELVKDAIELTDGRLQERGVTLRVEPNLPNVYGDRQRLLEVAQNLIDNAAKYMGSQPAPMIEIGIRQMPDSQWAFFVRDNGIGITPAFHERIFGLFNKLNPDSEGTGIGLALVKRIVEFHGGKVWVESETGQGATFFFTLPLAMNQDESPIFV